MPKSGGKTGGVYFIDGAGNVIKACQIAEIRAGSDFSGTSGDTSRVLTLQNASTSGGPVSILVEGQPIALADVTVSHLSSDSTITFDNINIFDTDTVRVWYYV